MRVVAIIVGGGKGKRMKLGINKAFMPLGNKPILTHSILPFEKSSMVDEVIVVVNKEMIDYCKKEIIGKYKFGKVKKVIAGGVERQDSVLEGLSVAKNVDYVIIHDAARPLVTQQIIEDCLKEAVKHGASVAAVPAKSTIKLGEDFVEKTLNRKKLWIVQTPQTFKSDILRKAYEKAKKDKFYGTDDSSLVERIGCKIKIVPSYFENVKITLPTDLVIAEALLKKRFLE